jgi:ferritin
MLHRDRFAQLTQPGSLFCGQCWRFYKDFIEENVSTEDAFKAIHDQDERIDKMLNSFSFDEKLRMVKQPHC